ncbi:heavy metal-binding domain-containing protein [Algicella marina]|uniref:UPF0145 protein GO499_06190 n=1 Tax=Algicella marina TaxID=2683284 RepID=A0A6P1T045_9RHOB|nr:heavy metal-binding domain-containing protein [Algicella marina]QHQ34816.1 heavy metal-binding domain-containing protein [Algicella marina]
MIVTTTPSVEGHRISAYHGIVAGEAIVGANVLRDLFALIRFLFGGRSRAYEREVRKARQIALDEMETRAVSKTANAIVGVDFDYDVINTMMMVSASGTAVAVEGL